MSITHYHRNMFDYSQVQWKQTSPVVMCTAEYIEGKDDSHSS